MIFFLLPQIVNGFVKGIQDHQNNLRNIDIYLIRKGVFLHPTDTSVIESS
jgi:hypothetical protein